MSETPEELPQFPASSKLIIALGIIAFLSGLLVVIVYEYTKPIIAENQRLATEKAIFAVLPAAKTRLTFAVQANKLQLVTDAGVAEVIYAGYDQQNNLVGVALHAAAQGYQDTVQLLYAYNPLTSCITGFAVLKSTETPGFGTKITTDVDFLDNFKCLQATVNLAGTNLKHAIKTVRHGTKQQSWEIDAIAGATITSNAIGRMLNASGNKFHALIAKNLTMLQQAQTK